MTFSVMSHFAGVGGIDLGFESSGKFKTIWANEIDKKASETFMKNFDAPLIIDDIHNLDPKDAPDVDVIISGFPCQAFSIAGYRKGFEDERGSLFFETLKYIIEKEPKVVFLENVKNFVGHDNGRTFNVVKEALEAYGYHLKFQVLNAKDFGNIPQNRERIYIVGFKDKSHYKNFEFPMPVKLTTKLSDVIYFDKKVDDKYYYTSEKTSFFDELEKNIVSQNSIYQWRRKYVRENKSGLVPTLTANMGTGGHNVPIILSDYGIRKLTPRECFNVQGFPESFILPDQADSHLYKQAGNSVVVPVVKRIACNIAEAIC